MAKEKSEEALIEEVDIEEYAKEGKDKPKAKQYKIRINKTKYTVTKSVMTGKELLETAGKDSSKNKIYLITKGNQPTPIGLDQPVDLTQKSVERFTTMADDSTEG